MFSLKTWKNYNQKKLIFQSDELTIIEDKFDLSYSKFLWIFYHATSYTCFPKSKKQFFLLKTLHHHSIYCRHDNRYRLKIIKKTKQSPGAASSYSRRLVWSFRGLVAVLPLRSFSPLLKYENKNENHAHLKVQHIMFNPLCLPNNKASNIEASICSNIAWS